MENYLSKELKEVIQESAVFNINSDLTGTYVTPVEFFRAIIKHKDNSAFNVLKELEVDMGLLTHKLEHYTSYVDTTDPSTMKEVEGVNFNNTMKNALNTALVLSNSNGGSSLVYTWSVVAGILRTKDEFSKFMLTGFNITSAHFEACALKMLEAEVLFKFGNEFAESEAEEAKKKISKTPILDTYSRDLTELAKKGLIDKVIGRDEEIERTLQVLSRKKKNNPVLLGEPGVGKTAIVEGLALAIADKKIPLLENKRLVALDMTSLVAGTQFRGQFEERVQKILAELAKNKDVIVFIDELHTVVGAGGSGSGDAANMFKPALARGEMQCIGATTLDEFRKYIEKDGALERRFQKVDVEEPNVAKTIEILEQAKSSYEDFHLVSFPVEVIENIVKLTGRYIFDRNFPDKALDVLDEVGAKLKVANSGIPSEVHTLELELSMIVKEKEEAIKNQDFETAAAKRARETELEVELTSVKEEALANNIVNRTEVTMTDVYKVLSSITGVPLSRLSETETKVLKALATTLKSKIIGQDAAVESVSRSIKRNKSGMGSTDRPIGVFLLSGPTGTGKTQLAKALAKEVFGSDKALIKYDMSEYGDKHDISKFLGSAPGFVGYEEGGAFEKVRKQPYSVVLFDEIEKAHPDIMNIFLQILDEGYITSSLGKKINFRNTIILLTSNMGAKQVQDFGSGVGFGSASAESSEEARKATFMKSIKAGMKPEIFNRLDEAVVFNSLTKEDLYKILSIELEKVYTKTNELGFFLELDDLVKDLLVDKGYDPLYGARPLKRAIQSNLEDAISDIILDGEITKGSTINLTVVDGKVVLK